ncbi:hypothetical protein Y032_0037g3410 [Ancylostoma ceylanicum]|nr:hypothetical protein Y032_0037g3410 [Ancylostoma ceylanicum]
MNLGMISSCLQVFGVKLYTWLLFSLLTANVSDGSPTVRSLSLRTASYFISTLKKAAQKQLKAVSFFFQVMASLV